MYTKVIKEIDGYNIIAFLDKLQIDPEGTKKSGSLTYFEPKLNEIEISDSEYKTISGKLAELKEKELLTDELNIIKNNKGVKYVKDNKIITIDKIGIDPDGKLLSDYSQDELEAIQILKMTDEEKLKYIELQKKQAMQKTINKKLELEILGDTEALEKSKIYYNELISAIEEKYK